MMGSSWSERNQTADPVKTCVTGKKTQKEYYLWSGKCSVCVLSENAEKKKAMSPSAVLVCYACTPSTAMAKKHYVFTLSVHDIVKRDISGTNFFQICHQRSFIQRSTDVVLVDKAEALIDLVRSILMYTFFPQMWHRCPLGLKDELILMVKAQGRCNLLNM